MLCCLCFFFFFFFFQAEDGIRDAQESRGLGDVYKRQALDFDSTERLFTKMRSLRDQGAAIFIVTHRIAELVRISDSCLLYTSDAADE